MGFFFFFFFPDCANRNFGNLMLENVFNVVNPSVGLSNPTGVNTHTTPRFGDWQSAGTALGPTSQNQFTPALAWPTPPRPPAYPRPPQEAQQWTYHCSAAWRYRLVLRPQPRCSDRQPALVHWSQTRAEPNLRKAPLPNPFGRGRKRRRKRKKGGETFT